MSSQLTQEHQYCTFDCISTQDSTTIIKYADDTTILDLIKSGDESGYRKLVNKILAYGEENDLILNIDKTKEIIMDFRRKSYPLMSLIIKGAEVERADSHKFLGLHVSSNLTWTKTLLPKLRRPKSGFISSAC